jgi:hypothetical protein
VAHDHLEPEAVLHRDEPAGQRVGIAGQPKDAAASAGFEHVLVEQHLSVEERRAQHPERGARADERVELVVRKPPRAVIVPFCTSALVQILTMRLSS